MTTNLVSENNPDALFYNDCGRESGISLTRI